MNLSRVWILAASSALVFHPVGARGGGADLFPLDHRSWRTEQGVPSEAVTVIGQDREGFLWVGTPSGLARFDGIHFVTYRTNTTPELRSEAIVSLHPRASGGMWVGTELGVATVRRSGEFGEFLSTGEAPRMAAVHAFLERPNGDLWIGTRGGHVQVRRADGSVGSIDLKLELDATPIVGLAEDPPGAVWIATYGRGVLRWTEAGTKVYAEEAGLSDLQVRRIHRDSEGGLWIISQDGALRRCVGGKVTVHSRPAESVSQHVFSAAVDSAGAFWTGHESGVIRRLDPALAEETRLGPNILLSDTVSSLFVDRENNLWAGVYGGGLHRLRSSKLVHVTAQALPSTLNVRTILETSDGCVWLGTQNSGLFRIVGGEITAYGRKDGLSDDVILSLAESKDGSLWAGTRSGGLMRLQHGRFEVFGTNLHPALVDIRAMVEDREGSLWVGTRSGGVLALRAGALAGQWARAEGLPSEEVRCLWMDPDGVLWVGAQRGGVVRLREGKVVTGPSSRELGSASVRCFHRDADGGLWIGTHGSGLFRVDGDRALGLTTVDGLRENSIYQILEDGAGEFWMSGMQGISRVRRAELEARLRGGPRCTSVDAGLEEGWRVPECNGGSQPAGVRTAKGDLWFATRRGAVVVAPEWKDPALPRPVVRIEAVIADRDPVPVGPEVGLSPGVQSLEIHYTSPRLGTPERTRFRYRLVGLESTWHAAGSSRSAVYSYLRPGVYRFEVQAGTDRQNWDGPVAVLPIRLEAFFWQTRSFYLGSACVLLAIGYGVHRTRLNMVRTIDRLERATALERERTRIAHEMHDDLGATLTQINLLGELASRQVRDQPEAAAEHLKKIHESSRQVFRGMDEIVWAVNPKHDTLDSLVGYVGRHALSYLQPTGIRCRLDLPAEIPSLALTAEARHNLFLVIKEALHNAVRHAAPSEVRLHVRCDEDRVRLEIQDDGKGFTAANASKERHGLESMQARAAHIGAKLHIESAPGAGTRVSIEYTVPSGQPVGR